MNYYIEVLKKYAVFSGRSARSEFWYFILFTIIIEAILMGIDSIVFGESRILYNIYQLVVFIPTLAVSVRRLHDVGKSGWMLLLSLLPIIGWVWILGFDVYG